MLKASLRYHDMFKTVDQESLVEILEKHTTFEECEDGTVIMEKGEQAVHLGILLSGKINVDYKDKKRTGENHVITSSAEDRPYFGTESVLYALEHEIDESEVVHVDYEADYVSSGKSYVAKITKQNFMEDLSTLLPLVRKENIISKLQSIPLLKTFTRAQITELQRRLDERLYHRNDVIITEGEIGDEFYMLQSGTVKVTKNINGTVMELVRLHQGTYFGERALVVHEPRGATITVASKEATIHCLSKADFDELISSKVADEISDKMKKRDSSTNESLSRNNREHFSFEYDQIEKISQIAINKIERMYTIEVDQDDNLQKQFLLHSYNLSLVPGWNGWNQQSMGNIVKKKSSRLPSDLLASVQDAANDSSPTQSGRRRSRRGSIRVVQKEEKLDIPKRKWPKMLQNEYEVLTTFYHDSCVNLLKAFTTPTSVEFLLEPALGGYLSDYLAQRHGGFLPANHVRFYVASVLSAVNFLHEQHIIYRSLMPDSIMLTADGHLKLAHFSRAKLLKDGDLRTYTIVGTPAYMAPEMLTGEGYDYSVDVWALGILTFELTFGESPFDECTDREMFNKIISFGREKDAKVQFPMGVFSRKAQKFLTSLICDVDQRIGCKAEGLAEIFDNQYFFNFSFDELTEGEMEPPYKPGEITSKRKTISMYNTKRLKRGKGDHSTFTRNVDRFDQASVMDEKAETVKRKSIMQLATTEQVLKALERREKMGAAPSGRRKSAIMGAARRTSKYLSASLSKTGSRMSNFFAAQKNNKDQTSYHLEKVPSQNNEETKQMTSIAE
eukprot:g4146.t1